MFFARNLNTQLDGAGIILYRGNTDFQKLIEQRNAFLKRGDIIATNHPKLLRYLLPESVETRYLVLAKDAGKVYSGLLRERPTYVYIDRESAASHYIQSALDAYPAEFLLVSSNKGGAIYKTSFPQ